MAISVTQAFLKKQRAFEDLRELEDDYIYVLEKCFARDLFNDDGTFKTANQKLQTISPFSKIEIQSTFKKLLKGYCEFRKWDRVHKLLKENEVK